MVDWKEHEHEDIDTQEIDDLDCLEALRNFGLLKLFLTPGIWAQPELLHYLISLWDINWEIFIIGDQELELATSDIYFITGISRRGEPVNLYGSRPIGESVTMPLSKNIPSKSGKFEIMTVQDLVLRVILLTINKVAGSQALHETNNLNF